MPVITKQSRTDHLVSKITRGNTRHDTEALNLTPIQITQSLLSLDPTKKKIYRNWLVKCYLKGEFRLEDKRLTEELEFYDQLKIKLEDKDIGKLSYREFSTLLEKHQNTDTRSNNQVDRDLINDLKANGDIEVYYKDRDTTISIPHTKGAAIVLGRGTKWCTSANDNNMFDNYNDKGKLYIVTYKKEKYQLHFEELQFMDDKDFRMEDELLTEMRKEIPGTRELFKEYEDSIVEDPKKARYYAQEIIEGRWPEAEPSIIKDLEEARMYASHVIKGRWKEAEQRIIKDPKQAKCYAEYAIKGRWPEAEPYIIKDAEEARHYCNAFNIKIEDLKVLSI